MHNEQKKEHDFFNHKNEIEDKDIFKNWILLSLGLFSMLNFVIYFLSIFNFKFLNDFSEHTNWLTELGPISLFITACIVAPLIEEIIFRLIVLRGLRRFVKFRTANIIQSILFGISHINPFQFIYTFFLGMLLGESENRFKRILAPITLHFIWNFLAIYSSKGINLIIYILVPNYESIGLFQQNLINILISILSLIIGLALIYKSKVNVKKIVKGYFKSNNNIEMNL